jgi:hypothetical protein
LTSPEKQEKAVRGTHLVEEVVEESNGELTEDVSDTDPPSSEAGRVILARPLTADRNEDNR